MIIDRRKDRDEQTVRTHPVLYRDRDGHWDLVDRKPVSFYGGSRLYALRLSYVLSLSFIRCVSGPHILKGECGPFT